ncbi:MAG TPA: ABC transporter substrate-binding protein, partial [Chloroflexota bacterium]|nr:ABC transporter substrate-binding protein [Chloroflexota bacterium]
MHGIRSLWGGLLVVAVLSACGPAGAPPAPSSAGQASAPAPAAAPEAPAAPAAAPAATAVAPLSPPVHVRIGTLPTLALAPFVLAEVRGYFAEEGIEVEYLSFDSGARQVAPLAAGQLDVGQGSHSAGLFNALGSGVDLKIVAGNGTLIPGRSTSQIVARKDLVDAGFKGGADLRGRSLAFTAAGSTVHINVMRYLDLNGVRPDEVSLVELGQADMNPALLNGAIDIANQTEPYVTAGIEQGYLVRLAGVADYYPDREVSVMMYGRSFADQQPEAARRFMVAYLRGVRTYEDALAKNIDREAVLDLLIERLPWKDRTLYDRMWANGTLLYINPDGHPSTESIAWDQDWMVRSGMVLTPIDLQRV